MHCNMYVTDYGEVRISEREMETLCLAEDIAKTRLTGAAYQRVIDKADAIKAACERFAKFTAGIK